MAMYYTLLDCGAVVDDGKLVGTKQHSSEKTPPPNAVAVRPPANTVSGSNERPCPCCPTASSDADADDEVQERDGNRP
jgi:hypothetical protein